jgi:SlyX protein
LLLTTAGAVNRLGRELLAWGFKPHAVAPLRHSNSVYNFSQRLNSILPAQKFVSNTGMDQPQNTDNRLTDLEIKASFTEDLVEQLNQVIIRQQAQIDQLLREVSILREHHDNAASSGPRNLRDDLPPHF